MTRHLRLIALTGLLVSGLGASASAAIVFGNLGPTSSTPLGTTNTDLGTAIPDNINWIAQGFNTGTSIQLDLQSVVVGIFGSNLVPVPVTVSIYPDVGSAPGPTPLYTSASTLVGTQAKYSFTFSPTPTLSPNTTYWVVPNGGSWYWNSGSPAAPTQQNSSGYSYIGPRESFATTATPSGPWDAGSSVRYSVSIDAVPEPSTWVFAAAGLGTFALLIRRRDSRG